VSEIVVDASVALCWFAREVQSPSANRLLRSETDLIAPSLLVAEIANALWRKCRRGEMADDLAGAAMREIHRFIPRFVDVSELAAFALELAREINHSVYDCCYLALALRRGSPLVTADRQFADVVAKTRYGRWALYLGDWV
jgi:predicted nucleic acid-binding protein